MAKYVFENDIRLLHGGLDEVRIRSGLWNYNEAVIDLSPYDDNMKKAAVSMLNALKNNGFDPAEIEQMDIQNENKQQLMDLLNGLFGAGMIYSNQNSNLKDRITNSLLGQMKESLVKDDLKESSVLFVSDCDFSIDMSKKICKQMELDIEYEGIEFIREISKHDLTTKFDAYEVETSLSVIGKKLEKFDSIVISLKHTNMNFLRNINRIALEYNKVLTIGFIDGPFITVFSINPPKTGCVECFETRILSRLEDHILYEKYVKQDINISSEIDPAKIILSSMLTNLLITEAYLLKNYSMTKFEGRVLSVFIPSLEIQVQDLLRVPYCNACGNISKAKFEETNIQSRVMMNDLLKDLR
ncbi:streptolysin associated protein SagC [Clostridiaceae bacterium M8S5]|nr:streptolysin associated protein SagC [Clostridiaceae bacterium M8S5]